MPKIWQIMKHIDNSVHQAYKVQYLVILSKNYFVSEFCKNVGYFEKRSCSNDFENGTDMQGIYRSIGKT